MKKTIGVLGIAVIAATMFFNVNSVNGSATDTSLTSLMKMNLAHADSEGSSQSTCSDKCASALFFTCSWSVLSDDNRFVTITCHDMYRR